MARHRVIRIHEKTSQEVGQLYQAACSEVVRLKKENAALQRRLSAMRRQCARSAPALAASPGTPRREGSPASGGGSLSTAPTDSGAPDGASTVVCAGLLRVASTDSETQTQESVLTESAHVEQAAVRAAQQAPPGAGGGTMQPEDLGERAVRGPPTAPLGGALARDEAKARRALAHEAGSGLCSLLAAALHEEAAARVLSCATGAAKEAALRADLSSAWQMADAAKAELLQRQLWWDHTTGARAVHDEERSAWAELTREPALPGGCETAAPIAVVAPEQGTVVSSSHDVQHQRSALASRDCLLLDIICHSLAEWVPRFWAPVCSTTAAVVLKVVEVYFDAWPRAVAPVAMFRSRGLENPHDNGSYGPAPGPLQSAIYELLMLKGAVIHSQQLPPGPWGARWILYFDEAVNLLDCARVRYDQLLMEAVRARQSAKQVREALNWALVALLASSLCSARAGRLPPG
eukprot:TRINITY_DN27885_c0_g1_i1.p1 TRINITY_DN27885_c0_g1~~TRINITY_DN27885_c0_g1_i1.p1  ORF type:complete len:463 (+),score=85.14 TRINITY_DN27885_c0_g1_i1:92-1480(+)